MIALTSLRCSRRLEALCLLGLLLPVLLVGLAGCNRRSPGPPSPGITLSYTYWALTPAETRLVNQLVADFHSAHPDMQVKLVPVFGSGYYTKLETRAAAGDLPDVLTLNFTRLPEFASAGLLLDLQPELRRLQAAGVVFQPAALAAWQNASGRGRLLAFPRDWSPANLLVVRKSSLEAAGLPLPRPPFSWQDLLDLALRLKRASPDSLPLAFGVYPYELLSWCYQAGGTWRTPEGRPDLLNPGFVSTCRFLQQLVFKWKVAPAPTPRLGRASEVFASGRCALAFVSAYSLAGLARQLPPDDWYVLPPLKGKRAATCAVSVGYAVSKQSTHPEAAAELAAFLAKHGARAYCRAGLAWPALRLPPGQFLAAGTPRPALDHVLALASVEALPETPPKGLPYQEFLACLRDHLEAVFLEHADIESELSAAQQALEHASGR